MSQPDGPYDFVYVHTDIPEDITIGEWRARRAAERTASKTAARQEGLRRRARAIRRWLVGPPGAVRHPWPRSREANG